MERKPLSCADSKRPHPGLRLRRIEDQMFHGQAPSARNPWGCRSLKSIKQAGRLALPLQWSRHGLGYEPRSQVQGEGPRQGKGPPQVRAWRRLTTEPLEGFLPQDCLCCGFWQATWPCSGHRDLKKCRGVFAQLCTLRTLTATQPLSGDPDAHAVRSIRALGHGQRFALGQLEPHEDEWIGAGDGVLLAAEVIL